MLQVWHTEQEHELSRQHFSSKKNTQIYRREEKWQFALKSNFFLSFYFAILPNPSLNILWKFENSQNLLFSIIARSLVQVFREMATRELAEKRFSEFSSILYLMRKLTEYLSNPKAVGWEAKGSFILNKMMAMRWSIGRRT